MTEWRETTLGELVDLQRGTTYKSSLLGRPGPVLLGLATIQRNGGFRSDILQTYGGESPQKLLLKAGDMYVSLKDVTQAADLLGAVARVPRWIAVGRLTQDTVKLAFKRHDVLPSFVYWLLRTPQYRDYCRARATGTTNLALSRDDFLAYPVPESSPSRWALVQLMDALDDKIELNRKLNETLVQMARAIFKSWFVDFEPFRDKGMVDSPLGRIPKGWDVRQVQTFADVEKGLSYKGQFLAEVGVPMVNLGCLTGHGRFNPAELKHYGGDFKPRHTVRPGDIVIANTDITQKREVLGSPAVVPPLGEAREFVFTHHVFAVRLREEYASWMFYVYYSLLQDEFRERAAGFATGTTVLALPRDAVLDLAIPAPPEQVVQAFSALVVPLVQSGWKNDAESRTLAAIRDALLPKLMSGEVKVA